MKDNKYLLKDGEKYVIQRSIRHLKQNSITEEVKIFAPELGTEETYDVIKAFDDSKWKNKDLIEV